MLTNELYDLRFMVVNAHDLDATCTVNLQNAFHFIMLGTSERFEIELLTYATANVMSQGARIGR